MAGTITALVGQKKNKERVSVYINDQFAFGVTLNAALNLKKGQYLTDDEVESLKFNDAIAKSYQRALHYLSFRPRTIQEIRTYLEDKDVVPEVAQTVIDRLSEQHYVDDTEFARLWVENRIRHNPKGERALRYELRRKGLGQPEIDQALEALDEETLAWQAIQKRLSQWSRLDALTFRKKLSNFLAYRGFSYDTIEVIFNKAWSAQNSDEIDG